MKLMNILLVFSLLAVQIPSWAYSPRDQEIPVYERLSMEEMASIIGGSVVGQVEIIQPKSKTYVSGELVNYTVSYKDLSESARLLLFFRGSTKPRSESHHETSHQTTNQIIAAGGIRKSEIEPDNYCRFRENGKALPLRPIPRGCFRI